MYAIKIGYSYFYYKSGNTIVSGNVKERAKKYSLRFQAQAAQRVLANETNLRESPKIIEL